MGKLFKIAASFISAYWSVYYFNRAVYGTDIVQKFSDVFNLKVVAFTFLYYSFFSLLMLDPEDDSEKDLAYQFSTLLSLVFIAVLYIIG